MRQQEQKQRELIHKFLNIDIHTKHIGDGYEEDEYLSIAKCPQLNIESSAFSEKDALTNLKVEIDHYLNLHESTAKEILKIAILSEKQK